MSNGENGLPIEQFIQALTSQLDRVQDTMALKARTGRPLTFAVKDVALDLRAHLDMVGSVVRIRPAGPGESDASTLRLALTTITRPMIEENTVQLSADPHDQPIREALGDEFSEEEERRLEWAGVRTVSQLRKLQERDGEHAIERVAQVPVLKLRAALERASQPRVSRVIAERPRVERPGDRTPAEPGGLLRIHGRNLVRAGQPEVRIGGERVRIVDAKEHEIVVAPQDHQWSGALTVEPAPGSLARAELPPNLRGEPPASSSGHDEKRGDS